MDEKDMKLSAKEWEKVGYAIGKVSGSRENLTKLRKQKIELRKLWSTFKYHNHSQPWYVEMIYRLGADIKDANRYQDELGDAYGKNEDLSQRDLGVNIYETLETTKRDIADEIAIVGETVMDLWELGVPLKTIAKAYGATENTTYIFITRQPRFKTRREHTE